MNLPVRSKQSDGDGTPAPRNQRSFPAQRHAPPSYNDRRRVYEDETPVFELADLRVAAGFPWRAFKRHRRLGWSLLAGMLALIALATVVMQRHYIIETRFFAEKNFVMPALGNPKRAVPTESDSPTRLAAEAVMRRTNLMEIIRQTKLMESWDELRSPLGKVKDFVFEAVKGPMTEADRLDAMIGLIEKRMDVKTDDGTISIKLDWSDPTIGFRMVEAAQQNFFEQRHASELALIGESIGIIEGHVTSSLRAIQEALAQINASLPKRPAVPLPKIVAAPSAPAGPSPVVIALQSELRTVQQTIADITSSRSQRLTAAQARLAELRGVYGSAHPDIAAAEENIRAMEQPSSQLAELRNRESAVLTRIAAAGGRAFAAPSGSEPSFAREALERLTRAPADSQEAPEVTFAKSRLKIATNSYEEQLDRLEGARIELETARAAFKYRYSVITPAKIPKKADKPKIPLLLIGGSILALLATMFAVVLRDFAGGRVLESWQVDRQLGLPVLAEVERR